MDRKQKRSKGYKARSGSAGEAPRTSNLIPTIAVSRVCPALLGKGARILGPRSATISSFTKTMSNSGPAPRRFQLLGSSKDNTDEFRDWSAVVAFHRQVIKQSEEDFYTLRLVKGAARWSPLAEDSSRSVVGPWQIADDAFINPHFKEQLEVLGTEFYLGLGCIQTKTTDSAALQPIFVLEAKLNKSESGYVLTPDRSKWSLSPTFLSLLDRMNIGLLQEPEELTVQILEAANRKHADSDHSLGEHVITSLAGAFEPLSGRLKPARWSWCLFAPPQNVSAYNAHLVRDYDDLSAYLEHSSYSGGLRLLEGQKDLPHGETLTPLSFVPLNTSQLEAVKGILGDQPVTVVSGPPGCGKSQVVVSTLLNAWALGKRTLFASTNNKAVDVVLERLQRFESEFPIAVRAGSKRHNKVVETIKHATSIIERHKRGVLNIESLKEAQTLQLESDDLRAKLDNGRCEMIDQQLKAALKAYADWKESLARLAERDSSLKDHAIALNAGVSITPSQFLDLIDGARAWIARIPNVQAQIDTNIASRTSLVERRNLQLLDRDRCLSELGLDPETVKDWEWLASTQPARALHDWWNRLTAYLDQPIEQNLATVPWARAYDEFRGANAARKWIHQATSLATELRDYAGEVSAAQAALHAATSKHSSAARVARNLDIESEFPIDIDSLEIFLSEHKRSAALASKWSANIPFTSASRARERLARAFLQVREHLPASLWDRLNRNSETATQNFLPIAEGLLQLGLAQNSLDAATTSYRELETIQLALSKAAIRVQLPSLSLEDAATVWPRHAAALDRRIMEAEVAAEAHDRRAAQKQTFAVLAGFANELDAIGRGMPLRTTFNNGFGRDFVTTIGRLANSPTLSDLDSTRQLKYSGVMPRLLEGWREAQAFQLAATTQANQLDKLRLPSSYLSAWWHDRPSFFADIEEPDSLPQEGDALLQEPLRKLEAWESEWHEYHATDRPTLIQKIQEESQWAHAELMRAVASVPAEERSGISHRVDLLLSDRTDWPISDLSDTFQAYSPEFLRSQLQRINSELESLSFSGAKLAWLDRASSSPGGLAALAKLQTAYSRSLRLKGGDIELFKDALDVLPIWIATGQGTASIPLLPDLFDLLIIDEASQCTLTNILPLLFRAKRLVVIGDKEQLPAIASIPIPMEESLLHKMGLSELEYGLRHCENNAYDAALSQLPGQHADVIPLTEHYRSHPLIIGFSNSHIYHSQLQLRKRTQTQSGKLYPGGVYHRHVIGTAAKSYPSWKNTAEANEVIQVIRELRQDRSVGSIGVVTPFRGQAELISELLHQAVLRDIEVGTAHAFQGDERDAIIFSPVVAGGMPESTSRWASDRNLINVAITRARDVLVIVCDMDACRQSGEILRELSKYCEEVERLRDSSPAELALFTHLVMEGISSIPHFLIGDAEVDFLIPASPKDICIEIDGDKEHAHRKTADQARDAFLTSSGYVVRRFEARQVLHTPNFVISEILKAGQPQARKGRN